MSIFSKQAAKAASTANGKGEISRHIMNCLHCYCNETLMKLELSQFNIIDDGEESTPIFHRVQWLKVEKCELTDLFLRMLPVSFPKLQELDLDTIETDDSLLNFVGLHQRFENLVSIRFTRMPSLLDTDIDQFFKCNPQVRNVHIKDCCDKNESFFQIFEKYRTKFHRILLSTIKHLKP